MWSVCIVINYFIGFTQYLLFIQSSERGFTMLFVVLVMQLHREFLRAGSDVMQAFTFYASDDKLENRGNEAQQKYSVGILCTSLQFLSHQGVKWKAKWVTTYILDILILTMCLCLIGIVKNIRVDCHLNIVTLY